MIEGNILKMENELGDVAQYILPIGDQKVPMNELVGKEIELEFKGQINCISTGEKIKKTYNQGYSYKAFMKLAACDICIVKPELCHYDKGTCREPEWGEKHCMTPHYVYLSIASSPKIGITRECNIPHRWIDQGATYALPILKVRDRLTSGIIENEIAKEMSDKTNWRKMLKGDIEEADLYEIREQIFNDYGDLLDDMEAEDIEEDILQIEYPIESIPDKIKSMSFDKTPVISGKLTGIKGQYLIFEQGVLNMRKHAGYYLYLNS